MLDKINDVTLQIFFEVCKIMASVNKTEEECSTP